MERWLYTGRTNKLCTTTLAYFDDHVITGTGNDVRDVRRWTGRASASILRTLTWPQFLMFLRTTKAIFYLNVSTLRYISAKLHSSTSIAELLLSVQKSKMAADAILDLIFVQYYGISQRRTIKWIHVLNFVRICGITSELLSLIHIWSCRRRG